MKKLFSILLLAAMLISMMAGCGGDTKPAEESAQPEESAAVEAPVEEPAAEEPAVENEEEVEEPAVMDGTLDFAAHKELIKSLTAEFPIADGEELSIWLAYETSSLQYVEDSDMQNILCYKLLEELTGVHLDMIIADMATSSEKFNIMAASGDYPDLLPGSSYTTGVDSAINDELIIELTDVIAEFCPNLQTLIDSDPDLAYAIKTNEGRIGSFPRINDGNTTPGNAGAFMRMDWLEALDMEVPATYDELEEVLVAFKTEFGATEPLMLGDSILPQGGLLTAGYDFTATVASGMTSATSGFYQIDGELVYGALTENFKEFTKMLSDWYAQGLINENCLSRATNPFSSAIIDPVLNGQTGMFYSNQPFGDNYNAMDTTGTINFYPVRDVAKTADQQMHFGESVQFLASGDMSISTCCEDIELAARYLDSLYSYDCYLILNYGEQGVSWDFNEEGEPQFLQSGLDQYVSTNIATAVWTTQSLPVVYAESRLHFTFGEGAKAAFEVWGTNKDNAYGISSKFSLNSEESEEASTISTDIITYISENYWKFITGEVDIDAAWDGYVETINTMGYERLYEIVQGAYDRLYA